MLRLGVADRKIKKTPPHSEEEKIEKMKCASRTHLKKKICREWGRERERDIGDGISLFFCFLVALWEIAVGREGGGEKKGIFKTYTRPIWTMLRP